MDSKSKWRVGWGLIWALAIGLGVYSPRALAVCPETCPVGTECINGHSCSTIPDDDGGEGDTGETGETFLDVDGDGYDTSEDCDDANVAINPGATEISDGADNDCDGAIDENNISCTTGSGKVGEGQWQCAATGTSTTVYALPSWSPDSKYLVYQSSDSSSGATKILLHSREANSASVIKESSSSASPLHDALFFPVKFTDDVSKLVFFDDNDKSYQLYTYAIDAAGAGTLSAASTLTANAYSGDISLFPKSGTPSFAPAGQYLTFINGKNGGLELSYFKTDGSYSSTSEMVSVSKENLLSPLVENDGSFYYAYYADDDDNMDLKYWTDGDQDPETLSSGDTSTSNDNGKELIYYYNYDTMDYYYTGYPMDATSPKKRIYGCDVEDLDCKQVTPEDAYSRENAVLVGYDDAGYSLAYGRCTYNDDTKSCAGSGYELVLFNMSTKAETVILSSSNPITDISALNDQLIAFVSGGNVIYYMGPDYISAEADQDGDGYLASAGDCNDANAAIYPSAAEINDGLDNDCDGAIDEDAAKDHDGDGYCDTSDSYNHDGSGDGICDQHFSSKDCDDTDKDKNPDAAEVQDGKDNDCDGVIDEQDPNDVDDDGDGYSENKGDCDDTDPTRNPGVGENTWADEPIVTDGIDNDCDGEVDEVGSQNSDNDGDHYVEIQGDCNDADASVYPGATEICGDGIDQDCSGADEDCPPPAPVDLDDPDLVTGEPLSVDDDLDGYTEDQGDCDDTNLGINPGATEILDNDVDENCDGVLEQTVVTDPTPNVNGDPDGDLDGYTDTDCNDADASIYPGALEVKGDGVDNDCDGKVDETSLTANTKNATVNEASGSGSFGCSLSGLF